VEFLWSHWPWLIVAAELTLKLLVSLHVVFTKRDSRSAIAWIAILWLVPLLGTLLYYVLGINRIVRRARRLRRRSRQTQPLADTAATPSEPRPGGLPDELAHLATQNRLGETVTGQPLCAGNRIEPLWDGDQAYPAMLQAIEEAQRSVGLCMYIFRNDRIGIRFVEALGRAVARGVEVRVLVDDIGAWQFLAGSITGPLRRAGVPTARFLPTFWPRSYAFANLRNHRKLLIVDGRVGFTGGMNITEEYSHSLQKQRALHDVQFRVEGPIVARLLDVFVEDWKFTTGEALRGERWFPKLEAVGSTLARGVSSGPDEDTEKLRLVLLGALASARLRVVIVTPYFLPDADLVSALNIAALRGVQVDILLPTESDLSLVQWAANGQLAQVLDYGCRVWIMPGTFMHTKLMLVDGDWTLLGSANWDARSLRLNFEFNLECYDRPLTESLERAVAPFVAKAERMTLRKLHGRRFLVKLRDGVARLLSPYL
jgi:cardiolipin synthase